MHDTTTHLRQRHIGTFIHAHLSLQLNAISSSSTTTAAAENPGSGIHCPEIVLRKKFVGGRIKQAMTSSQGQKRLSDLDTLLDDLERTIESSGESGDIPATSGVPNNDITTTEYREEVKNLEESYKITESSNMASSSPLPAINQNINELDVLLRDLSIARYSSSRQQKVERQEMITTSTVKSYKVVKKTAISPPPPAPLMPTNNSEVRRQVVQEIKSKSTNGGIELDQSNKWGYMGYGVWENEQLQPEQQRRVVQQPASTATRELDDLMTSLNSFKLRENGAEEPVSTTTTLDDMLGNLKENMDKHGIKTVPKGVCSACEKPIVGQVITALGKTWHPEHFTCVHCNQELGTKNFFERDEKPYCEDDYHTLFSPKCAFCQQAILDKCISALDRTWHPEHFLCADCNGTFGDEGFHEKDDKAYCQFCFFSMFAPKCGGCNTPITENYISSLNAQWHPNCFVCAECGCTFNGGNFFEHEGRPYCETHYHALRGSLCAGCHKPISGRCITAMFRKFHPEHFVCSFCLKQLNKGTFKEQGEKPYCHECYDRLFG